MRCYERDMLCYEYTLHALYSFVTENPLAWVGFLLMLSINRRACAVPTAVLLTAGRWGPWVDLI